MYRTLLAVDVQSSGGRDNQSSVILREALFEGLRNAFEASGINLSACVVEDQGDGMIVIVPPEFPKPRLIFPMLEHLDAVLRHHNRYAANSTSIRVRAALHAGDVRIDKHGVTGRPKVLLARLLDSKPLRNALAGAPEATTVVHMVSDRFHDDVVAQGNIGIDPDRYVPVQVQVKETTERAWLHVPREHGRPKESEPPQPAAGGVSFSGSDVRIKGDVVGGNKIVHRDGR